MKKTIFFTLFAILTFIWQGMAQEVQVGNGTETDKHIPIEPYYKYSYSQQIYLASEINTSGTITEIKFKWNGYGDMSDSDEWTIYMGHTTKTQFDSNTDWVDVSTLTQVFSGTVTFPSTGSDAWVTIDITDFDYNGTDNLIIAVDENAPDYDLNGNEFYAFATSNNRSMAYYNDSNNPDPASPPTANNVQAYVSNIIFVGIQQSCPNPLNLTVSATSLTEATVSWDAGSATQWELEYGPAGFSQGSGTMVTGLTSPSYNITGLTSGQDYDVYVRADCGGGDYSAWANTSWYQPAEGDECQYAINLTVNSDCSSATPYNIDFSNAVDVGHFSCDSNGTNYGRWFNFTAPASGKVKISSSNDGNEFVILDGCGGNEIVCDDAGTEFIVTGLTSGNTYVMAYWNDSSSATETDICLEEVLYTNPVFTTTVNPDCGNSQFTVDVEVTDLGGASSVTVSDNQGSTSQQLTAPGTVTFGPYADGASVTFTVTSNDDSSYTSSETVEYYCPPANDACETATEISSLPFNETLDATNATNNNGSIDICSDPSDTYQVKVMNDGVWYKFTVGTANGDITVTVDPDGWDAEVQVYSGNDCNNLSCVDRSDSGGTGGQESVTFTPSDNTTYYVNVGYWSSSDGSEGPFTIDITGSSTLAATTISANDFRFYPNPTQGVITWDAQGTVDRIQVVDLTGKVLFDLTQPRNNSLDISRLNKGVYLLNVQMGDKQGTYRIVKE